MQHNPTEILKKFWSFDEFRPLQKEIIDSVLNQQDALALLPTGGGKSICFQIPALCNPGLCLVVTPLIALMEDQVQNLKKKNISAEAIHAGIPARQIDTILDNCVFGKIKFLYLSPERIASEDFQSRVQKMNVNLIAVDEAHCISQWGYDFRPAYLKIANLRTFLPQIPVLALTASATPAVVKDIQEKLLFTKENVFQKSFTRENLCYILRTSESKWAQILTILKAVPGSSIIYVRNRKSTKEVSDFLTKNRIAADFYHAGLSTEIRKFKQKNWVQNKSRVMVCTNAFGMGIDKPDVRTVIHIEPADSLEAYYQEAGRAGRDGVKSYAVQLIEPVDFKRLETRKEDFPTAEEIKDVYEKICENLRIAMHAGAGENFDFNLSEFSYNHKINPTKILISFKILEYHEVLFMSEGLYQSPQIFVPASKEVLYKFQVENRKYDPFIKFFLRTCAGIFNDYVNFNEVVSAKKLNISLEQLYSTLQHLQTQGIFYFKPRKENPSLFFVQSRVSKSSLYLDLDYIQKRKKAHAEKIEGVETYLKNKYFCRSKILVKYFGENLLLNCGKCDICLSQKKTSLTTEEMQTILSKLEPILAAENKTLEKIADELNMQISDFKNICDWLLEAGTIERLADGKLKWL